jgi:SAM-dependent methyltransferase
MGNATGSGPIVATLVSPGPITQARRKKRFMPDLEPEATFTLTATQRKVIFRLGQEDQKFLFLHIGNGGLTQPWHAEKLDKIMQNLTYEPLVQNFRCQTNPEVEEIRTMFEPILKLKKFSTEYRDFRTAYKAMQDGDYAHWLDLVEHLTRAKSYDLAAYGRFLEGLEGKSEKVHRLGEILEKILLDSPIYAFEFNRPFGYWGDMFMIELLYHKQTFRGGPYEQANYFVQLQSAAKAVRNRKEYAISKLRKLQGEAGGKEKSVLVLGSGPVSEVADFIQHCPGTTLKFSLLDNDKGAIGFAKERLRRILGDKLENKCSFHAEDLRKFEPSSKFDLIFSLGVFDYLNDLDFVSTLVKYKEHLKRGGVIIVGNFGERNVSKHAMELFANWVLLHRPESHLLKLAQSAGYASQDSWVESEPLGINHFLNLRSHD